MPVDRKFRLARIWSNQELEKIASFFGGDVVNVSAWKDSDKVSRSYRDYFTGAASYSITNYAGFRGHQGGENEYELDLTADLPDDLRSRFDVVFNHTTLEHIFDARRAFGNLCDMSRDAVIVVVPFSQIQHETGSWKDYWRFTPTCMREFFRENGLEVIYEAANTDSNAAIYLLFAGARSKEPWQSRLPAWRPIDIAGHRIGDRSALDLYSRVRRALSRVLRPGKGEPKGSDPEPD